MFFSKGDPKQKRCPKRREPEAGLAQRQIAHKDKQIETQMQPDGEADSVALREAPLGPVLQKRGDGSGHTRAAPLDQFQATLDHAESQARHCPSRTEP